ncbi:Transmembrane protein 65 [Halotydeus destructor]|nr:Transmembrane protein 65 [Halotydeus destructor]
MSSVCHLTNNIRRATGKIIKINLVSQSQYRHFKYKSFLSDVEGTNDFIDLLGRRERQLLLEQLQLRITASDNEKPIDSAEPLAFKSLRQIFINQSLPFVGFGFLDNLIMILAGDYIDTTIGATLGITTMAAAGLGNALSDVAGVGSAWYVERLAASIGIEHPHVSPEQASHSRTRWTIHGGRAFGVFVGCLIGMAPLLFLHNKGSDHKQKAESSSDLK